MMGKRPSEPGAKTSTGICLPSKVAKVVCNCVFPHASYWNWMRQVAKWLTSVLRFLGAGAPGLRGAHLDARRSSICDRPIRSTPRGPKKRGCVDCGIGVLAAQSICDQSRSPRIYVRVAKEFVGGKKNGLRSSRVAVRV